MVKKKQKRVLPKKRLGKQLGFTIPELKAAYFAGAKQVEQKHNLKLSKKEKLAGFHKTKEWLLNKIVIK